MPDHVSSFEKDGKLITVSIDVEDIVVEPPEKPPVEPIKPTGRIIKAVSFKGARGLPRKYTLADAKKYYDFNTLQEAGTAEAGRGKGGGTPLRLIDTGDGDPWLCATYKKGDKRNTYLTRHELDGYIKEMIFEMELMHNFKKCPMSVHLSGMLGTPDHKTHPDMEAKKAAEDGNRALCFVNLYNDTLYSRGESNGALGAHYVYEGGENYPIYWNTIDPVKRGEHDGKTKGQVYINAGEISHSKTRVKMNTFTDGKANRDGILQVWHNGKLVVNRKNMRWHMKKQSYGFNTCHSIFTIGGAGAEIQNDGDQLMHRNLVWSVA